MLRSSMRYTHSFVTLSFSNQGRERGNGEKNIAYETVVHSITYPTFAQLHKQIPRSFSSAPLVQLVAHPTKTLVSFDLLFSEGVCGYPISLHACMGRPGFESWRGYLQVIFFHLYLRNDKPPDPPPRRGNTHTPHSTKGQAK